MLSLIDFSALLEFISPKGTEEEGIVKFEVKAALKPYGEDVFLRAGYSANGDITVSYTHLTLPTIYSV